jgi:hypothetical protein
MSLRSIAINKQKMDQYRRALDEQEGVVVFCFGTNAKGDIIVLRSDMNNDDLKDCLINIIRGHGGHPSVKS